MVVAAMPSSNLFKCKVTSFIVCSNFAKIHLSADVNFTLSIVRISIPSAFISTKREAFQTLFKKLRLASILFSLNRISLPAATPVTKERRKESAPYSSITSRGLIPLPSDLLIFLPCASRTIPCITISLNGNFPVYSIPEKTMRITQKKRISYPQDKTSVG